MWPDRLKKIKATPGNYVFQTPSIIPLALYSYEMSQVSSPRLLLPGWIKVGGLV